VKLPRRAPREVYRVYAEEDFLADADQGGLAGAEEVAFGDGDLVGGPEPPLPPADPGPVRSIGAESGKAARRLRRAAGAATLTGAAGALVVLFAVNGLLPPRGAGRRLAQDGRPAMGTTPRSLGAAPASHRPRLQTPATAERSGRSSPGGVVTSSDLQRGVMARGSGSAGARGYAVAMGWAARTSMASLTASARAGSQPTVDPEFSFER
jgi:hypothetical protein